MSLNHPETIPPPQVCGKLSSKKLASGAKKIGDHCITDFPTKPMAFMLP